MRRITSYYLRFLSMFLFLSWLFVENTKWNSSTETESINFVIISDAISSLMICGRSLPKVREKLDMKCPEFLERASLRHSSGVRFLCLENNLQIHNLPNNYKNSKKCLSEIL